MELDRFGAPPSPIRAGSARNRRAGRPSSRTSSSSRRRFARTAASSAITSTSSKKRSSGGAELGGGGERRVEVALATAASTPGATRSSASTTSRSALLDEQPGSRRCAAWPLLPASRLARVYAVWTASSRASGSLGERDRRAAPAGPSSRDAGRRAPRARTRPARRAGPRAARPRSRQRRPGVVGRPRRPARRAGRCASATRLGDVDREPALEREPAEADRRPAQPVRVARARRPLAERERDGEVVELVGGREHAARLGRRQRAAGGVRQVLLLDRRAHRLGVAGEPRVLGADVALELGELAHELGGLVGLREPRRLARAPRRRRARRRARRAARVLSANDAGARDERDRAELAGEPLDARARRRARR